MKIQRLTTKREKGYSAPDIQEAIDRLGRLEDLYEALYAEQDRITADMERLSLPGRADEERHLPAALCQQDERDKSYLPDGDLHVKEAAGV